MEALQAQALDRQVAPIKDYIYENYKSWEQHPIVEWIILNVEDDDYILALYAELKKLGKQAFLHPCSHRLLFDWPLSAALKRKRSRVVEGICTLLLEWNGPRLLDFNHALVDACLFKEMGIVRAYLQVCGPDFLTSRQLLELAVRRDFREFISLCRELGADPELLSSLWDLAVSEDMRKLLGHRTAPTQL